MIRIYRDLLSILLPRERRQFYVLLVVAVVSALLEAVSIAAILPLLSVLSDPDIISENSVLSWLYAVLDASDIRQFQMYLSIAVLILVVGGVVLKMATFYAATRYGQMRGYSISVRLLRGYLRQPYAFFLDRHSAEIGRTVLAETYELTFRILQPSLLLAANVFIVFFIVLALLIAEPMAAMVVASVLGITYGVIYLSVRDPLYRLGRDRLEANEDRFRLVNEPLEAVKYVKLRGLEEAYVGLFHVPARFIARANAIVEILRGLPRYAVELVGFGGLLVYIMVNLAQDGGRDISDLIPTLGLIAFAGVRLLPALQKVFVMLAAIKGGEAILELITTEIHKNEKDAGHAAPAGTAPLRLTETLEMRDVTYIYPRGERQAASGLSFIIPARSTVGMVGGTGAGKTTAVDLLLGLIVPTSGEILVDGVAIDNALRQRWQRTLGYVPQTIFLTADSIASNIAFGVRPEEIDMERVIAAAKTAALHDFVEAELPQGYDTLVGERGVMLSGGQRQRVGIARALYFDPDVLIFDEATSALDNITERVVMEAIERLGGEKTIIMIAHRLSTVRNCDQIFLLQNGCVEAKGTYDELSENNAEFREMVRHA